MTKQEVLQFISALPDDVSLEDVLYHLYVISGIHQGQKDIDEGRAFTHEQVKGMFQQQ